MCKKEVACAAELPRARRGGAAQEKHKGRCSKKNMAEERKEPAGLSMSLDDMSKGKRKRDDERDGSHGGYSKRNDERGNYHRGYSNSGSHGGGGYHGGRDSHRGGGDSHRSGGSHRAGGYHGGDSHHGGGYHASSGGHHGHYGGGGKRPRDEHRNRHGKAAAAAAYVPPPKVAGVQLDDEGHLWFDEATGVCTYFQDRRRKWPFFTGPKGKEHLEALVRANATLRARNRSLLEQAGDPDRVAREGERLCPARGSAPTPTPLTRRHRLDSRGESRSRRCAAMRT